MLVSLFLSCVDRSEFVHRAKEKTDDKVAKNIDRAHQGRRSIGCLLISVYMQSPAIHKLQNANIENKVVRTRNVMFRFFSAYGI